MRLLICDDHVVFAESLAHLLAAKGVEVIGVTHHPAQAILTLRETPVDVCLIDVMFGAESLLDRLSEVRAAAPDTPIAVLSGRVDGPLVEACRQAGVRGVAEKRQPIAEILDMLRRVHAGERVLPDGAVRAARVIARVPINDTQRLAGFLTLRERQVLGALVCGVDTARLARTLGIAETTARSHIQAVLTKLGAHSRLEAATTAVRHGMVDPRTGEWLLRQV
jgi:two-component system nitrate/nitrite response regulator NarL